MDRFHDAVMAIYDAAAGGQPWEDALAHLLVPLHAKAVILEYQPVERGETEHFIGAGVRTQPRDITAWQTRGINQRIDLALRPGQILRINDFSQRSCPPDFVSLLGRYRVARSMSACIGMQNGTSFYLHATRHSKDPPFATTDEALLTRISKHLRSAFKISARMEQLDNIGRLNADISHGTGIGIVLIDPNGYAYPINGNATEILAGNDTISIRNDRLTIGDPMWDRELQSLITQALTLPSDPRGSAMTGAMRIDSATETDNWRIIVKAVSLRDQPVKPLSRCAVVYLLESQHHYDCPQRSIRQGFGLTAKETEIVCLVLNGAEFDTVREQLNIGYSTLRFHLGSIYEKLGVRTKTELIRLLALIGPVFFSASRTDLPAPFPLQDSTLPRTKNRAATPLH
ncbi:helix-turn-helix transcriptional regulator [Croceicoccus estronivorus]|uniref:helix-turn-helix transcriptional regulator n=1 Tax=Croceicoccus estronivorus TaxID=1172626 RepID=UPI001F20362F|nr:helix-turn-helix transcriptional regulator [Croceicoccus estronivorus]